MTEIDDLEKRVRDLEAFNDEMRGGRKMFFLVCGAIASVMALLAAFWEQLSGSGSS